MINIKLENKDTKVKVTVEGHGNTLDLIKECTFLIDSTTEIYKAVIDELPSYAQLIVMSNALDSMVHKLDKKIKEDNND